MTRRLLAGLIAATLVLAGCGGGDGGADSSTTTADEVETPTTGAPVDTTVATTDDDDGGQTVGIGDIPQECVDAFVAFLREMEPIVEGVDWESASLEDLEALGEELEPLTADYEAATAGSACEDLEVDASAEESFQYMIDLASREAPGTVPYFEMIRDFAGGFGEGLGAGVSNDCETDIAAVQAIVDEGGSMAELEASQLATMGGLVASITANCSTERAAEFFSQEDITNFMGG